MLRLMIRQPKEGERCTCPTTGTGQWVVKKGSKFYVFDPPTQLQKDLWLDVQQRNGKGKKALESLRWYCALCDTVQMP